MRLHVNIDHVATIRQARGATEPDPVWAAAACELAGAHGITVHLREDRRHIQDRDVELLRRTVRSVLNLEMAATEEMVGIARRLRPDLVTLVPEKRTERTTEGGLDVAAGGAALREVVRALEGDQIPVSLFIDPSPEVVRASAETGARRIELHTGHYAEARGRDESAARELERLGVATEEAVGLSLMIAAGHGLHYTNVALVAAIQGIEELNIGHAIVSRAVFSGLDRAVRDMLALLPGAGAVG